MGVSQLGQEETEGSREQEMVSERAFRHGKVLRFYSEKNDIYYSIM